MSQLNIHDRSLGRCMRDEDELLKLIESAGIGPILIHSDISKVMGLVPKSLNPKTLFNSHLNLIEELSSNRGVIFPTFNYDFIKTKVYDIRSCKSQVGALSEYARREWSNWRSHIPVFNFCGNKSSAKLFDKYGRLSESSEVDPFDESSIFHALYENDGVVLMYGASFKSFTGIHYIEHCSGRPLYRYDKFFPGKVYNEECRETNITVKYHVRPLNADIDYRWKKLLELSITQGAVKEYIRPGVLIYVISFRKICDLWIYKLVSDPLFLLDEQSKKIVEPKLKELGRRFSLKDFE